MGTNYYCVSKKPTTREPIHIGKSSWGWKFLFQEVNGTEYDWSLQIKNFDEWKKYLEEHIGKDMVILSEEDEEISLEDFLELVETKQANDNPKNFVYSKDVNGYRFSDRDFS